MSAVAVVSVLYNRNAVAVVKLCAVVTRLRLFDPSLSHIYIAHREKLPSKHFRWLAEIIAMFHCWPLEKKHSEIAWTTSHRWPPV